MFKKFIIAVIVVFIVIELLNMLLHGVLLSGLYQRSASIWRPMQDMNRLMWVIWVATFLQTVGFVFIYYKFISNKTMMNGLWYGLVYGFAAGIGMGYSTYAMLPMPYALAVSWFIGAVVIYGIAGLVTGIIIKEKA